MKLLTVVLAALAVMVSVALCSSVMASGDLPPQGLGAPSVEYQEFDADKHCDEKTRTCRVGIDFLFGIAAANVEMDRALHQATAILKAQAARIQELEKIKGCGKLTCVEPSKRGGAS